MTPKIHFWRLAKIKPCTAVSPLHPTPSPPFSSFFHLSKNFLIFFIYPSKEILRTRFVVSFRSFLFLLFFVAMEMAGWKFSIAFLQFTEAAIHCEGLIFSYGGKWFQRRFRCLKKRSFVNFYGRRSLLIVRIIFLVV